MAICSHCGRQSQANAQICQFCGYPLTAQEGDISVRDTVYTAPPVATSQNGAQGNGATPFGRAFAKVIVRPLQGNSEPPREFALTGQTISIGRSPSCEIVLDNDQLTSRRHALLRYDGARYTVVDLGSSNGTFVNDSEIRDATALNNGDRIIVGEHELMFTTNVTGAAPVAGVDLNGAPPSRPLSVTGAPPVVNPNQQETSSPVASAESNGDDADTSYMATVMTPMATADVSDVSDVSDTAGVANTSDVADVAGVSDTSAIADEASAPASDVGDANDANDVSEQPSSGPLPPPTTPDNQTPLLAHAPSSGALRQPGGELDQLRTQLAQLAATSEAVAQHAAQETDLSEQRRQALAETRDQLHAILAGIQNAPSQGSESESDDSGDLSDLIALSKQTAADPNHLQNVSRLAEHANEISQALQALQARRIQPPRPTPNENALAELRALQARLDELA